MSCDPNFIAGARPVSLRIQWKGPLDSGHSERSLKNTQPSGEEEGQCWPKVSPLAGEPAGCTEPEARWSHDLLSTGCRSSTSQPLVVQGKAHTGWGEGLGLVLELLVRSSILFCLTVQHYSFPHCNYLKWAVKRAWMEQRWGWCRQISRQPEMHTE